jgi:plasmid segregation protein ParM
MSYNTDNINLVTGLPIAYYSKQKQSLIKELQAKEVLMKYNGISKLFTINKCLVFPQSAGLFVLYPDLFKGDVIVIDIGGMTVDVSYFEGLKLIKYATYPLGMLKLYGKLIQEVNAIYGLNLDILDAEKIIRNGLCIDNMNVGYNVAAALAEHAEEILRPIKLEFPYKTAQKINIGGGAEALRDYLSKGSFYPDNNIFANADAFYEIGVNRFDS